MASIDGIARDGVRGRSTTPASRQNWRTTRRERLNSSTRGERSIPWSPRDGTIKSEDSDEQKVSNIADRSYSLYESFLCSSSSATPVNESRCRVTSSSASSTSNLRTGVLERLKSPKPSRRRRRLQLPRRTRSLFQEDSLSASSSDRSSPRPRTSRHPVDTSSFATRLIQLLTSLKDIVSGKCACSSFLQKKQSLPPERRARGPLLTVNIGEAGKERPLLEDCVRGLGWETCTSFFNGGDIHWLGNAVPDYEHALYVSSSLVVNRFPGLHDVAKKQYFARVLSSMQELQPQEYDFFPVTWILPEDRVVLETLLRTRPKAKSNSPPSTPSPLDLPLRPLGARRCSFLEAEQIAAEESSKSQPWPAFYTTLQKRGVRPGSGKDLPLFGAHRDVEFVRRMREAPTAQCGNISKGKSEQKKKEERTLQEDKRVPEGTEANGEDDEDNCEPTDLSDNALVERVPQTGEAEEAEKPKEEECKQKGNYRAEVGPSRQEGISNMAGKQIREKDTPKEKKNAVMRTPSKLRDTVITRPPPLSSNIQIQEAALSSFPPLGSAFFGLPGYSRWESGSSSTAWALNSFAAGRTLTRQRSSSSLRTLFPLSVPSPVHAKPTDKDDSKKKDFFILKPDAGAQGMGVRLVASGDTLPKDILEGKDGYIVQQYIANPYLLEGKKFDFRIYVLLLNVSPRPQVLVSRRGLVRFCTESYKHPKYGGLDNPYAHLTNYAINKEHRLFMRSENVHSRDSSKRLLDDVLEELRQYGVNVVDVWQQILTIIRKTMAALIPLLCLKYRGIYGVQTSRCFQIIGFDILLDKRCKAWLLEVNANPSLRSDYDNGSATSSGVWETCESQLDRHVKEPLVREALILVYCSMISRYSGLSRYGRCRCRRAFENGLQQHTEQHKEKQKKKRRVRRIFYASPTQVLGFSGKTPESNKYVYLNSRKLQQGQAASTAGGDAVSSSAALWRRSLSQGEHGLLCRTTISTGKKNKEKTQTTCEKSKTVVAPAAPQVIPPAALAGSTAVDLPPRTPVMPSDVITTVTSATAAAVSDSFTERCFPLLKTAAPLLLLHSNESASTMKGFPTSEGARSLSLPEHTAPREPAGKPCQRVAVNALTACKRERKRLSIDRGVQQPQQQVLSLRVLMDTTAIPQPDNAYNKQKVSTSAGGTGETAANTFAHLFSDKDSTFSSSVQKGTLFAPPYDVGAAPAPEAFLHERSETPPRQVDQTPLSQAQGGGAGSYGRMQEKGGREERQESHQSPQRREQTTPVQYRQKTLKSTLVDLPPPDITPELGPREKFILLIRQGATGTPATTAGREWTRTISMSCFSERSEAGRPGSGQTVVSHVHSSFVSEACNSAFNSHILGPVHNSFPVHACCDHATPSTPACTSVTADAAAVGDMPANLSTAAGAAELPAGIPGAECIISAGTAQEAVTGASLDAAERNGVHCGSKIHKEIAGTSRQHEASLFLSPSIKENAQANHGLTILACKRRAASICLSVRKANFSRLLRNKSGTTSPSRSSEETGAVAQILPRSPKQNFSSCSNEGISLRSELCYEGRAPRSVSCEARPRWSSASTRSSRSPSLQSRHKSPCCCNLASVCEIEGQVGCTLCSGHHEFSNVMCTGLNTVGSAAAGTAAETQQEADNKERRTSVRRFRDALRTENFDVAPISSSEEYKETPSAILTASVDAAAYFLFDANMTAQLCVWEPLNIIQSLSRPASHLQRKNPQTLSYLSGPLLLERGRRLFERITRFPTKRTVQLDDWTMLCSQSRLQELLCRFWVTVPPKERSADVLTGGNVTGTRKAVRTCRRFQQRPLNKRDLILLYMRQHEEELHAQASGAVVENCGLSFWSFWEMLCSLSALTGMLLVRCRQSSISELCFCRGRDVTDGHLDREQAVASRTGNKVRGNSTLVQEAAIEKCVSQDEAQQKGTSTDVQSAAPDAPVQSLEQLIRTKNAENNSTRKLAMHSKVSSAGTFDIRRGSVAGLGSGKWNSCWNSSQSSREQILPLLFIHQEPNVPTSVDQLSEDDKAFNSFLVANRFTLPRRISGDLAVRPDERIFVPWMPDIRRGYYLMTAEQRTIAVDCLLSFFGV